MLVLTSALSLAACTGTIASDGSAGNAPNVGLPGASGSSAGPQGPGDCSVPQVAASPLRRLTRQEYNNTVRDLLGDTTRPADRFVAEAAQHGFTNGADSTLLSPSVVEDFENAAAALATAAVANLPALLGCDPAAMGEDACAQDFMARFGARAFRRPLEAGQASDYTALYQSIKPELGFAGAIELVLRAMLQSPYFLYRLELGMPDPAAASAVRLSAPELASRLSYLIWGSMPDDQLFAAAASGKLETAAGVRAEAERLLNHERGAQGLTDFHVQWGQLAGVPDLQKNDVVFTPQVGRLLLEETARFVDGTLRTGDGLLQTLLTSSRSYLNAELASYYGVSAPAVSEFQAYELAPGTRAGLLTLGAFMANLAHGAQASPVLRGKFVMEQMLCSPPPAPPDNVDASLPAIDPSKTAREQLTELTGQGVCAACHQLINPPGFAFEHFDALGRYRETDRGLPIDASGDLQGPGDANGHFENHMELMQLLANSETVRSCVVSKWFVYAHGRASAELDTCSLEQMREAFRISGGNVRDLLLHLTETPAFMYRTKLSGGAP